MKEYEKPVIEYFDLRLEERIAGSCFQTGHCGSGSFWAGLAPEEE